MKNPRLYPCIGKTLETTGEQLSAETIISTAKAKVIQKLEIHVVTAILGNFSLLLLWTLKRDPQKVRTMIRNKTQLSPPPSFHRIIF